MFLSITGESTLAEVRGGYQTRMFEVFPGGKLTLTQLKLSGGSFEGSGGAIYSHSAALVLDSCTFQGNVAADGDGGAVWAERGNITIIRGEFLDNNASVYGGAVAAAGVSSLVVQGGDTSFTSNIATGANEELSLLDDLSEGVDGGGAVAFLFASANIADSVFDGNNAQFSGGALLGGNGTYITVDGCKFENNTAMEHGGAIAAAS
ncbi:unnamed protein product, partial [Laminaria digitata]